MPVSFLAKYLKSETCVTNVFSLFSKIELFIEIIQDSGDSVFHAQMLFR